MAQRKKKKRSRRVAVVASGPLSPDWTEHLDRLTRRDDLRVAITSALNQACAENESNTPDFVLAEFLLDALKAFDRATQQRDSWYGVRPIPSNPIQHRHPQQRVEALWRGADVERPGWGLPKRKKRQK